MNKSKGKKDTGKDKSEGEKDMKNQDSKMKSVDEIRSGGLGRNPLDSINQAGLHRTRSGGSAWRSSWCVRAASGQPCAGKTQSTGHEMAASPAGVDRDRRRVAGFAITADR